MKRTNDEAASADLLPPSELSALLSTYGVAGVTTAVLEPNGAGDAFVRTQTAGLADRANGTPVFDSTLFQICSLSKPIAAVYALQYFAEQGVAMETSVNSLLAEAGSPFRFRAAAGADAEGADAVNLTHLIDHTGPQLHYVNGIPRDEPFPPMLSLISGSKEVPAPFGYAPLDVAKPPGTKFGYSGGGFLVLQHLLEQREGKPIGELFEAHLRARSRREGRKR